MRNAATTRKAIFDAARRLFAGEIYENVGLREIAAEVGIDPALIIRYFGSKEALFREILRSGKPDSLFQGVAAQDLPVHMVSLIMDGDDDCEESQARLERVMIFLRSASSSKASAMVHEAMNEAIIEPIAALLDTPDARLRACMALTILSGSGMLRQILGVKPVCDTVNNDMRKRLLKLFETALRENP